MYNEQKIRNLIDSIYINEEVMGARPLTVAPSFSLLDLQNQDEKKISIFAYKTIKAGVAHKKHGKR